MNAKPSWKTQRYLLTVSSVSLLILTLLFPALVARRFGVYLFDGMAYSVSVLLPSTLPFMIVSDAYGVYGHPERIVFLASPFALFTGFPAEALGVYTVGCIAGFPIGARMSGELYAQGKIEKKEAERLSALSNQPSIAYLLGVVGIGLRIPVGGWKIVCAVACSSLLTAIITSKNGRRVSDIAKDDTPKRRFDLVSSVRNAGASSVYLTVFVALFYALTHYFESVLPPWACYFIYPFLEVCSGCEHFLNAEGFLSRALLGFTLGFGGICVAMQSAVFLKERGLSILSYLKYKATEGIICGLLCSFLI